MRTHSFAAFLDELEKIGAARLHGRGVLSVRKGRRPISASNLLKKEKDGKLHKFQHVKEAFTGGDSAGQPSDVSGGWEDEGAAKPMKHRGEVPTEVKSTTMSTKEGGLLDKARSMGAGAVHHATQAAKGQLHAGAEEIAAAAKPHIDAAAERLIEAGRKAQVESAPTVGAHAGRAAVDALKSDAKKVWDDHKGKIIGGAAAAYGANKAVDYSIQKHASFFDELSKIATVPGAMGSVNPMTTGENPLASPETRQKPSPGDIPTQDQSSNIPSRTESAGPQVSTATGVAPKEYAPRGNQVRRRGDVPGMPKDPSAVDHMDGRGEATTVTGLAQNSSNIGAFQNPAEHVG